MMKLFTSILTISLFCLSPVFSQTDIGKYTSSIKEVQEYLLSNDFTESFHILKKLENEGYSNANMSYLLGICCLNSLTNKSQSIDYLQKATKAISEFYNHNDPAEQRAPAEAMLYLGDAFLVNNNIKDARICYLKYLNYPYLNEKQKDIARLRIKNCLFARLQMDNPLRVQLENAGIIINSGIANSNACISADGKKMVFLRTMKFYDALLYTEKTDFGWTEPINITTQVGSDGEFVPTALSPDGNRLLLKSFSETYGYDIFESVFNGKKWSKMKRAEGPLNSKFHDIDATYAEDGKTIYFSSNRTGGLGGYDIYKAVPDEQNQTYTIQNIGNTINTIGNEKSPSLIENDKTIIFSTDYRNSMGGYDYYYSQHVAENQWTEPLNIGYPINSTSDDNNLKFTSTLPRIGYLSRYSSNSYTANDIFHFTCPVFSTLKLVPLSGKIKINETDNSSITLAVIDATHNDTTAILKPNDDGSYFTELYPGNFNLVVKKDGETTTSSPFSIPYDFKNENFPLETEIVKPAGTSTTQLPDTIYIQDVLFGFNQWQISENEAKMLTKTIEKLKNIPLKSIRLYGFTDSIGNEEYNLILSQKRAQSVKSFISEIGLNSSEIIYEGVGAKNFKAPNTLKGGWDNPNGRALNRRVEIVIILENNTTIIIKKNRVLDIF